MGLWFRLLAWLGSAQQARAAMGQAREKLHTIKATAQGFQTASFQRTRQRAGQGDVDAQYQLGEYYYDGRVVIQDYEEAFVWFLKAAEQGNPKAQLNVGLMLSIGRGASKDAAAAHGWLVRAAEQDAPGARDALNTIRQRMGQTPQR